jgi:diadenosine tetraphosphate (Ap4A) HIT family hydrolase
LCAPASWEAGLFVASLPASVLLLGRNQFVDGYCVLVSSEHVRELHHLSAEQSQAFVADLRTAAAAVEKVFAPAKLNLEMLGNQEPHLHCHIKPRYAGDAFAGRRMPHDKPTRELEAAVYRDRIRALREAL